MEINEPSVESLKRALLQAQEAAKALRELERLYDPLVEAASQLSQSPRGGTGIPGIVHVREERMIALDAALMRLLLRNV